MPAIPPTPDPLDPLFARWRAAAPAPADDIETRVWRRLAAKAAPSPARAGLRDGLEAMFARASFTAAFVVACILLGLFLAETRISGLQAKRSSEFVLSYLRQIDPQFDAATVSAPTPAPRP
jgi:hypothetical protein